MRETVSRQDIQNVYSLLWKLTDIVKMSLTIVDISLYVILHCMMRWYNILFAVWPSEFVLAVAWSRGHCFISGMVQTSPQWSAPPWAVSEGPACNVINVSPFRGSGVGG